jgi:hypothetical protein
MDDPLTLLQKTRAARLSKGLVVEAITEEGLKEFSFASLAGRDCFIKRATHCELTGIRIVTEEK